MWSCEMVSPIWEYVLNKLREFFPTVQFNFSFRNILYNAVTYNRLHLANLIVLIVKYHIYSYKCRNLTPSMQTVKNKIELYHQIEWYISCKSGDPKKIENKWGQLML